jgi:hypothetical protein
LSDAGTVEARASAAERSAAAQPGEPQPESALPPQHRLWRAAVRDSPPSAALNLDDANEIRDRHPAADMRRRLAASRHSRLTDEVPRPLDDFDVDLAARLCADICRQLLRDYAPGLLLVSRDERLRVQALAAYARTLFDFAAQRGLAGERLAQINRWEFTLESALAGEPIGQLVRGDRRMRARQPVVLEAPPGWRCAGAGRRRARPALGEADERWLAQTVLRQALADRSPGQARLQRYVALTTVALGERPQLGLARRIGLLLRARFGLSRGARSAP